MLARSFDVLKSMFWSRRPLRVQSKVHGGKEVKWWKDKLRCFYDLLLMEEIPHQLVWRISIPLCRVFYTSQVVQEFFHQKYDLDTVSLPEMTYRYWQFTRKSVWSTPSKKTHRRGIVVGKCLLMDTVWWCCFEACFGQQIPRNWNLFHWWNRRSNPEPSQCHIICMFSGHSLHNRILKHKVPLSASFKSDKKKRLKQEQID